MGEKGGRKSAATVNYCVNSISNWLEMGLFENSLWFLQYKVERLPFFYFMFADPLLFLYDLFHPTMCDLKSFQEYRELQSGHAWEGTEITEVQGWNQSIYMSFLTLCKDWSPIWGSTCKQLGLVYWIFSCYSGIEAIGCWESQIH